MKAVAAIMLMTAAVCTVGCNKDDDSDEWGGNNGNGGGGFWDNYTWVDLGLPSGTLWATCNVGANAPEEYGDYFAWGETQPKDYYDWNTYKYCNGDYNQLTKYCNNSSYGYNGFTDNLTILQPMDDAATANWGSNWCMPTREQWQELIENTTDMWTTMNGVYGRLFSASNGCSLFLPASGYRDESGLYDAGDWGGFVSSSLYTREPDGAWSIGFYSDGYLGNNSLRYYGLPVRPVRCDGNGGGGNNGNGGNGTYNGNAYVDLGLPSGTLWATCNVGAETPEDYGDYFAWGETQPKDTYDWSNYKYCNGSSRMLTKYCNKSEYGYNGFTDNLTVLQPSDDAATMNWGTIWRIPTKEEWEELCQYTTMVLTSQNGVEGCRFTGLNGNSLFLPGGSYRSGRIRENTDMAGPDGSEGEYLSSSLCTNWPIYAWWFIFDQTYASGYLMQDGPSRDVGRTVRPVRSAQ